MEIVYHHSIEAFKTYSNFQSLRDFNHQIEMFLAVHKKAFTKREFILFRRLTKYSAKVYGVSNASIRTILTAAKEQDLHGESVSESTFHRMKRKAIKLGILERIETKRSNHSQSSNLWVFQRFTANHKDDTPDTKETTSEMALPSCLTEKEKTPLKTNNLIKTNKRLTSTEITEPIHTPDELDYRYVPHEVNQHFIDTVRPFFDKAYDIYTLWQLTLTAYKESALTISIQDIQETITQAFRTAIFFFKQGKIRKTFKGYFYAVLKDAFNVIYREHLLEHDDIYFNWLGEDN